MKQHDVLGGRFVASILKSAFQQTDPLSKKERLTSRTGDSRNRIRTSAAKKSVAHPQQLPNPAWRLSKWRRSNPTIESILTKSEGGEGSSRVEVSPQKGNFQMRKRRWPPSVERQNGTRATACEHMRTRHRFAQHSKKRRHCSFPKRFLVRKLRVPAPLLLVRKRAHFSHAFELHFASQRRRKSASERPFSSVQKRLFFTARCGSKVRPKHVLERSFFNSHLEVSQC